MLYTLENGKTVSIPDSEIINNMKALEISQEEAIELWLDDNDYTENEEQDALDRKAKKAGVGLVVKDIDKPRKERKPRTCKVSDEKQLLFNAIHDFLATFVEKNDGNVEILTENKMFSVKVGGKSFKINITQDRDKK